MPIDTGSSRSTGAGHYEFSVEQRRYPTHWESVKLMRRRHQAYDGSAGPREQTLFFRIDYSPSGEAAIHSTLGAGRGQTDADFRHSTLEISADVGRFAPFERYRITQRYDYEAGALDEEVSLLRSNGQAWVRSKRARHALRPPSVRRRAVALGPGPLRRQGRAAESVGRYPIGRGKLHQHA